VKKSILSQDPVKQPESDTWLDLEAIADVEITSEDPAFPIENALGTTIMKGWRAATTGPQVIRLLFSKPQTIRRVQLQIVDSTSERSQEFVLIARLGDEIREIARQQWNFSPQGTTEELEDYDVALSGVSALELKIDPDRSHDPKQSQHIASLERLRIA
jgi:hypothetical protein